MKELEEIIYYLIFGNINQILLQLIGVSIIITIMHELGHAIVARFLFIPISRINIGIGPKLLNYNISNFTIIQLNLLPLNGNIIYNNNRYSLLTGNQKALLDIGGLFGDLLSASIITLIISAEYQSPFWNMITYLLYAKIILTILALTSDGRRFYFHLFNSK